MAQKRFEHDDPFEPVATVVPTTDIRHIVMMAETFIDEFLRMGWPEEMILGLFKTPFYQGPYAAYKILGEDRIATLLARIKAHRKSGGV